MQAATRGYIARSKMSERKAAVNIQLMWRRYKFRKYFRELQKAFANVRNDPHFGKYIQWPQNPAALGNAVNLLYQVLLNWWAYKMVTSLTSEQQAAVRQKIAAYNIFHGKKPWACGPKWNADYLEKDTNPASKKYAKAVQLLFQKYGDTNINFSAYANKINRVGKVQRIGVVVTNLNIYKYDAKSFKMIKFGTPISTIESISLSPNKDGYVILKIKSTEVYRDLLLDFFLFGEEEKYSEFVTVLSTVAQNLGGNPTISFITSLQYNNSRKKGDPGKVQSLSWQSSSDPKQQGTVFKNQVLLYK